MKIRSNPNRVSRIGALFIRLLGSTWRVEWTGLENLSKARKLSKNVIFAIWHGRLLVFSYTHRNRNIQVLASEHHDGDLMGRTIQRLGFGHLKGSSSRGGARAVRELASVLKSGLDVGLTVDGPRGPRGVVQQGAMELSRLTGKAVVPMTNTASRRRLFRSWDRFQLPFPFSRVTVSYGEPLMVGSGTTKREREEIKELLQNRLNEMTSRLDRSAGYEGTDAWPHEDI